MHVVNPLGELLDEAPRVDELVQQMAWGEALKVEATQELAASLGIAGLTERPSNVDVVAPAGQPVMAHCWALAASASSGGLAHCPVNTVTWRGTYGASKVDGRRL